MVLSRRNNPIILILIFIISLFITLSLYNIVLSSSSSSKRDNKAGVETKPDQTLKQWTKLNNDDLQRFNQTLKRILVPRVVDTPSHANVKNFIVNYLNNLEWTVEQDEFETNTPMGRKKFTNIVGTLNPQACKRIVLACHYDSKYFPDFDFLGATDSAVPCTMILELLRKLDPKLKQHKNQNDDITLQVIMFDGEEAFQRWTNDDSLYGSRHLAARLNSLSSRSNLCPRNVETELDRIQVLILLDLIGEASPRFCSYYSKTQKMFDHLSRIERKLNRFKLLETNRLSGTNYFSRCPFSTSEIEDDHIPFQKLGVNILHIISTPFPLNWHLEGDDGRNLHHPTINNLMKIFQIFILEELKLI
ncbi:hypothetical protein DERP_003480 [Dermatophagoides pteronyssinus]|uniref:glutaminyl-peptide cyclotransferase n=1 Tax=Dermatophagoides pteronyssinus TaxID=6956 RepID=A0ABQ8JKS3_DERPT|nr:hypothetical protein DERP_003480 [Dermatophagoides pteronyssinus]